VESTRPQKPLWALEVLASEATMPTTLWVGLINNSTEAQLVCVLDRGINYDERDGSSRSVIQGGSPHACVAEEQFQLVRSGQSHFIRLAVPKGLPARVSGRIRVQLGVVEPSVRKTSRRETVAVKWEGTLQDAAALWNEVMAVPAKGK
jgi:hypothetical protein